MWGKFLAEEVRRGELRSWFCKMTSYVKKTIAIEIEEIGKEENTGHRGKMLVWRKMHVQGFVLSI